MRHFRRKNFFSLSLTVQLIILNSILFFSFWIAGFLVDPEILADFLALKPSNLFSKYYFWTLLSSMFLHANFFHLFVNMFSLFFIGSLLEKIVGKRRFFWIYIISGIFAGLFFAALSWYFGSSGIGASIFGSPLVPAVGASGALFALLGVLAVLTPNNRIYLIAGPLIALILQSVAGKFFPGASEVFGIFISLYIVFSIFAMISFNPRLVKFALPIEMPFWLLPVIAIVPLILIGMFVELPIGNMAHLGGLIAGLAYGFYLSRKYPNKTRALRLYFSK